MLCDNKNMRMVITLNGNAVGPHKSTAHVGTKFILLSMIQGSVNVHGDVCFPG